MSFKGLSYAWSHPKVRRWCFVPSLLHLLLTAAAIYIVYRYDLTAYFSDFQLSDPEFENRWLKWISSVMGVLNSIVLFFIRLVIYACAIIVAFVISMVLSGFVLEKISVEVECIETGSCRENSVGFFRSTANELKMLLRNFIIYLFSLISAQLLHFIPVIGSLAAFTVHAYYSGWFVSTELLSATLPRHHPKSSERMAYLKGTRSTWIPFGWGASLLLFVPGTLPWLTAASAKHYFDIQPTQAQTSQSGASGKQNDDIDTTLNPSKDPQPAIEGLADSTSEVSP